MLRKTMFFLILLRLAIGWHFFFEGYHKIHLTTRVSFGGALPFVHLDEVGPTETSKPFSSEMYFREATGPLGPTLRAQLGDLDEQALARLSVGPLPEGKDPKWVPTADLLPPAVAAEIDEYLKRFLDAYKLDEAEKKQAEAKAAQTKEQVLVWLTFKMPEKEQDREAQENKMWRMVKKTGPDGKINELPMTTPERVAEYRAKIAEVRELRDHEQPTLGHDVEKARLLKAKADVAQLRNELLADLDKVITTNLKDGLNGILKDKLAHVGLPAAPAGTDEVKFLLPAPDGDQLPEPYNKVFDDYAALVVDTYKLDGAQKTEVERKLKTAKGRTVAWLTKKETKAAPQAFNREAVLVAVAQAGLPVEGAPLLAVAAAIPAGERIRNDALGQVSQMKATINAALTDDQANGIPSAPPKSDWNFLNVVNQLTMWVLAISGACLLLGFLTRLNCVILAGFLLLTYLSHPPFPWISAPPNSEGFYLFVNKNLIEMLALLVLATTLSGRWLGLDAILHRIFGREKPTTTPIRPRTRAA